jgi:hypothetical protein
VSIIDETKEVVVNELLRNEEEVKRIIEKVRTYNKGTGKYFFDLLGFDLMEMFNRRFYGDTTEDKVALVGSMLLDWNYIAKKVYDTLQGGKNGND